MEVTKNKIEFTTKRPDGAEVKLAVVKPSVKVKEQGQLRYAKAFAELVSNGALLKAKLDAVARAQNIWDDARQAEFVELVKRMNECERKLPDKDGKVREKGVTLTEARKAALQLRRDRFALQRLMSERSSLEANTAERLAEDARFNYFVSACTVYAETGKQYFSSLEDYSNRSNDDDASEAATQFAYLFYDYDPDFDKKLPENDFLLRYQLCDEKLRLINKDGKFVNEEGQLINENGEFVNEHGERIGDDGQPLPPADEVYDLVIDAAENNNESEASTPCV